LTAAARGRTVCRPPGDEQAKRGPARAAYPSPYEGTPVVRAVGLLFGIAADAGSEPEVIMKRLVIAAVALVIVVAVAYNWRSYYWEVWGGSGAGEISVTLDDPFGDSATRLVYLDQGWGEDERNWFYTASQGSWILPYSWFLVLEEADSELLFRRDEKIRRYRYITARPDRDNPDGLPVGFVKDDDEDWMGFTCAACHTGQFTYQGTAVRIDGGQTLGDSSTMMTDLTAALRATLEQDAKFDRFAANVLKERYSDAGAIAELRQSLRDMVARKAAFDERNHSTVPWGYGRVDALGTIFNQVTALDLDLPENRREPDGPVSYPFIWDTPQHDRVQWNGALANAGLGSLARNVGEVLGVWGRVDIDPGASLGYESTVRARNLVDMEESVRRMYSPQWPEDVLPPIDRDLAALGQPLYERNCLTCHVLIDRTSPTRTIEAHMVPVATIGTDPTAAMNTHGRNRPTRRHQVARPQWARARRRGAGAQPAGQRRDRRHTRSSAGGAGEYRRPREDGDPRRPGAREPGARPDATSAELQGAAAERRLGHRPVSAQRLGAQSCRVVAIARRSVGDLLSRPPRVRPGRRRLREPEFPGGVPLRHDAARKLQRRPQLRHAVERGREASADRIHQDVVVDEEASAAARRCSRRESFRCGKTL